MIDDLLQQNWIALPEIKRPHEVGKVDDPKYCLFHRLISHPLKDCFVLKEKIQELLDRVNRQDLLLPLKMESEL